MTSGRTIALTIQTFVSKVMTFLFLIHCVGIYTRNVYKIMLLSH